MTICEPVSRMAETLMLPLVRTLSFCRGRQKADGWMLTGGRLLEELSYTVMQHGSGRESDACMLRSCGLNARLVQNTEASS